MEVTAATVWQASLEWNLPDLTVVAEETVDTLFSGRHPACPH